MNIPCCQHLTCPGTQPSDLEYDSPLANYSSEAPDAEIFIGLNFGWDLNIPNLGDGFGTPNLPGVCESTVSQDDADLCAANTQFQNTVSGGGTGNDPPWTNPNGTPVALSASDGESCGYTCPDGSVFTWNVAPGAVVARNLILADRIASSLACNLATLRHICLPDLPSGTTGVPYSATIIPKGGAAPYTFTVFGSLPPGLVLSQNSPSPAVISGIPTRAGSFGFTLIVQDGLGNFMQRNYTLLINGVNWGLLVWDNPMDTDLFPTTPPNFGFINQSFPSANSVRLQAGQTVTVINGDNVLRAANSAFVPYNGPDVQTSVTVAINNIVVPLGTLKIQVGDNDTSALFLDLNLVNVPQPSGVREFPFTVPASTQNIFVDYVFELFAVITNIPFTGSIDMTITYGP